MKETTNRFVLTRPVPTVFWLSKPVAFAWCTIDSVTAALKLPSETSISLRFHDVYPTITVGTLTMNGVIPMRVLGRGTTLFVPVTVKI